MIHGAAASRIRPKCPSFRRVEQSCWLILACCHSADAGSQYDGDSICSSCWRRDSQDSRQPKMNKSVRMNPSCDGFGCLQRIGSGPRQAPVRSAFPPFGAFHHIFTSWRPTCSLRVATGASDRPSCAEPRGHVGGRRTGTTGFICTTGALLSWRWRREQNRTWANTQVCCGE
jgi:hypothetical protein